MTQQHEEDTRVERVGPPEPEAVQEPTRPRSSGGAAFYGWLVALGMVALLTVVVGAAAAAVDYAVTFNWNDAKGSADTAGTIGIVSGAILLLILAIAYYNGGYVAGRLARSAGARHGFGVWLIGVVVTAVVAALAALAGSEYDVLDRMGLPIADRTLTTGGLVAAGAALLITLLAAMIGGKAGQRYHRTIATSID
ncbi:MAG TPA: hypothetical protein VFH76_00140 [Kribbella sp.]|nr:hypothetical protein [Kribbella sp.]